MLYATRQILQTNSKDALEHVYGGLQTCRCVVGSPIAPSDSPLGSWLGREDLNGTWSKTPNMVWL